MCENELRLKGILKLVALLRSSLCKGTVAKLHPLNPRVPCMHLTSLALSLSLTLLVLLLARAFVSRRSRTVGFRYSESSDMMLIPSHSVT